MEHREVVRRRRMVRAFDERRPVSPETVGRLLEAFVRAPSAGNAQGTDVVVLADPGEREAFWAATTDPAPTTSGDPGGRARWLAGMRTAPLLMVVLADEAAYRRRYAEPDKGWDPLAPWPVPWWDVDAGMGALLVLLASVDEGLGACLFGVPPDRHRALADLLGLPGRLRAVAVVAVGVPAVPDPARHSRALARSRRPLAERVHRGRWGEPWHPTPPYAPVVRTDQLAGLDATAVDVTRTTHDRARDVSDTLSALIEPHRLLIVRHLRRGARPAGFLAQAAGISPSLASHHLAALVDAGLVVRRQSGTYVCYAVVRERLADVHEALGTFTGITGPAGDLTRGSADDGSDPCRI